MHILRKPLAYYDKIYLFSPNLHQDKIQDLQELMQKISKKVGYPVLEMNGPEDVKNTTDYPSDNRKIVIFDDMVNAPEKIQQKNSKSLYRRPSSWNFPSLFDSILL